MSRIWVIAHKSSLAELVSRMRLEFKSFPRSRYQRKQATMPLLSFFSRASALCDTTVFSTIVALQGMLVRSAKTRRAPKKKILVVSGKEWSAACVNRTQETAYLFRDQKTRTNETRQQRCKADRTPKTQRRKTGRGFLWRNWCIYSCLFRSTGIKTSKQSWTQNSRGSKAKERSIQYLLSFCWETFTGSKICVLSRNFYGIKFGCLRVLCNLFLLP